MNINCTLKEKCTQKLKENTDMSEGQIKSYENSKEKMVSIWEVRKFDTFANPWTGRQKLGMGKGSGIKKKGEWKTCGGCGELKMGEAVRSCLMYPWQW